MLTRPYLARAVVGISLFVAAATQQGSSEGLVAAVLPHDAVHWLIHVTDVVDALHPVVSGDVPRAAAHAHCQAVEYSDEAMETCTSSNGTADGTGRSCTLRAALELAAQAGAQTAVTLALRPGRFRLAAPLPEVVGSVQIVGSAGRTTAEVPFTGQGSGQLEDASATAAMPVDRGASWTRENTGAGEGRHARAADEADDIDAEYREVAAGQASPIGTVIDGGDAVQILRTGRSSALHLRTLRLEHGRAMGGNSETANDRPTDDAGPDGPTRDRSSGDPRRRLGGAVCSVGQLVLTNVAVRDNFAESGGGIYSEGQLEVHQSVMMRNEAHRCGGALYAAHGGKAAIFHSEIAHNRDHCHSRMWAENSPHAVPRYALGGGAPAPQLAAGSSGDALAHAGGGGPPRGAQDVSGAIAEGPPLSADSVAVEAAPSFAFLK